MQSPAVSRIPDPDYDRHPAYGALFGRPEAGDRMRALARLLPQLGAYAVYDLFARLGARRGMAVADADPSYAVLQRDGAVPFRFTDQERAAIHDTLAPFVAELRRKLAGERTSLDQDRAQAGATLGTLRKSGAFSAVFRHLNPRSSPNELFLHEDQAPAVFAALRSAMEAHGALAAASRYQGRPLDVRYLKLLINQADDSWWRGPFADLGLADPPAATLHVDHLWTTKAILYVSEVGPSNGPFRYCLGSNHLEIGWLEGAARRANDRVDLSSCQPDARRLFNALPGPLRRKAKFGNDLLADDPALGRLLATERQFTSADGDLVVFDDRGIHRGGLLEQGERIMAQVRLG